MSKEHLNYLNKKRLRKTLILATQIFILIAFFALWELAAVCKLIDPFIFSQPSRIFRAGMKMIQDRSLFLHVGVTLGETAVGFIASTLFGTLISVLLWWNDFLKKVLEPYLVILNSVPKTALAPIIIVWIGNNVGSVVATAIMTSIVVTILNVLNGFAAVDSEKIKLIKTFGGTKMQVLTKVILPANIPTIINALKINVGLSFVGVIVGEFLVAKSGLGYLIVYGSQIFKMDWVMLSIIILSVLAAVIYRLVVLIEAKLYAKESY